MRSFPRLFAIAVFMLAMAGTARAAVVQRVDIRGLDEAMAQNVRVSLSLVDAIGKDVTGRRMAYLVRVAEDETREALEPFGYYAPTIAVQRDRDAGTVTITVTPGAPVRVRASHVVVLGEGADDRALQDVIATFAPAKGDVFVHPVYEASKAQVGRTLAERGYFDADYASRRVEVTRAQQAADIDLTWNSGIRYQLGSVAFAQTPDTIIRPGLFDKLVPWTPGTVYEQEKIDRLRHSLVALDYFSRIEIEPQPEHAQGRQVPIAVTLTPAKRSIYTAGLSYGTDSGPGVRLGVERRYLNSRGHKALAQVDYAQRRKTLTLQYRVPAFALLDGWYTASLQAADEQTDYIDTRRVEFVASRSGEVNRYLTAVAALHVLRERWAFSGDLDHPDFRYGNFVFPELRAEYIDADDRLYPRNALGGSLELRGAAESAGSDATFVQVHARANWFKGVGTRDRVILRGELGHTFTNTLTQMPPSLRFYAGGIRSIRGYNDREVGPRIGRFGLGAKNVITASSEYEHYFSDQWGMAAFADGGDAFDGSRPDWHTGIGIGLRWRSPVGPVRVDLARGLDDPDSGFALYLNIGADL